MKEVTLVLNENELQILGHALGKLPLEMSLEVFTKIKSQTLAQLTEEQSKPELTDRE